MVERVALASTDASSVGTVPLSVTTLRDDTWPSCRYYHLAKLKQSVEKRSRNGRAHMIGEKAVKAQIHRLASATILNGVLIATPAPNEAHENGRIGLSSDGLCEGQRSGAYYSSTDVVLSDIDVVQPDLLFVSTERTHIITPDNIHGADLVVEILSPSTASGTEDTSVYAHGVKEYYTDAGVNSSVAGRRWRRLRRRRHLTSPTLAGCLREFGS